VSYPFVHVLTNALLPFPSLSGNLAPRPSAVAISDGGLERGADFM
jgi:hypothetical protein